MGQRRLGELLRYWAFSVIYQLKHRDTLKFVKQHSQFEQRENPVQLVEQKLNRFLNRAQQDTIFYQAYRGKDKLIDYPLMKKVKLVDIAAQVQSKAYRQEDLVLITTSGSYGTPFHFPLSKEKRQRQHAQLIYFGEKSGYRVGDRYGYFRNVIKNSLWVQWMQNQTYYCTKVLDEDYLIQGREKLKRKNTRLLLGFPSAMAMLANYCVEQGDQPEDFEVKLVISGSETLTEAHRSIIKKAFGVDVHDRYSTEEFGVLGTKYGLETDVELNNSDFIFEILHLEKDEPVQPGEIGRIVVTDLHSDSFPLIRYETGDLGMLGEWFSEKHGWAKSLKTLSGREVQLINGTDGKFLFPIYFDSVTEAFPEFVQYQLIQYGEKEYEINVVPGRLYKSLELIEEAMKEKLRAWVGADAQVRIIVKADIEKLPSGKRPFVINNYR